MKRLTVYNANNQTAGVSYDAAGNQLTINGNNTVTMRTTGVGGDGVRGSLGEFGIRRAGAADISNCSNWFQCLAQSLGNVDPSQFTTLILNGLNALNTPTVTQPMTSGGGGGSGSSPQKNGLKQLFCSALPQGRVVSVNGSIGILGGQQGSAQQVVNYNNGQVSKFLTGGVQVGWNGGAGASVSAGFVYDTQGRFTNSDFSGPFSNVSASTAEGPGGSVSWSGGVKVVQGGVGVSLIPGATANYSYTWTPKPLPAGNISTNTANPLGALDLSIYVLRKLGGC